MGDETPLPRVVKTRTQTVFGAGQYAGRPRLCEFTRNPEIPDGQWRGGLWLLLPSAKSTVPGTRRRGSPAPLGEGAWRSYGRCQSWLSGEDPVLDESWLCDLGRRLSGQHWLWAGVQAEADWELGRRGL